MILSGNADKDDCRVAQAWALCESKMSHQRSRGWYRCLELSSINTFRCSACGNNLMAAPSFTVTGLSALLVMAFFACICAAKATTGSTLFIKNRRKAANFARLSFCFQWCCIAFAEIMEMREEERIIPRSKQRQMKARPMELNGTTCIDPGVWCVRDQWVEVNYWYEKGVSA